MSGSSGSTSEEDDFFSVLSHAAAECEADGSSSSSTHGPEPELEPECDCIVSKRERKQEARRMSSHAGLEATDEGRIAATLAWLEQLAQCPGGPRASFHGAELRSTTDAGVGVFASSDLPVGHTTMLLSRQLTVSHQRAMEWSKSYNDVGSILCQMNVPVTTCIAIFLVCEQATAVDKALNRGTNGVCTIMSGWAASLPGFLTLLSPISALRDVAVDPAIGSQSTQTNETGDAIAASGKGAEVVEADSMLRRQVAAIEEFIDTELRRGAMAPFFPKRVFSRLALRWALGTIYSRGLRVGGTMLLMPLMEMANHAEHGSQAHNLELVFDAGGAVIARTIRPVIEGEELRLCYHQNDTAAHMHSKYGIPLD